MLLFARGGDKVKIKLDVCAEHYDEIRNALLNAGIEIDDNAELTLSDTTRLYTLMVKDPGNNDRIVVSFHDIISIETYGHDVLVYTSEKAYIALDRLYKVLNLLPPDEFLRVSNSAVIAKSQVRKITPTLSMKFILTMADGRKVDVTRSYYYIFKEQFGI